MYLGDHLLPNPSLEACDKVGYYPLQMVLYNIKMSTYLLHAGILSRAPKNKYTMYLLLSCSLDDYVTFGIGPTNDTVLGNESGLVKEY